MLASSVPVIAYDSPGPPMMLSSEYLVPRGDINGMASKVAGLLEDLTKLQSARSWAKEQSQRFDWVGVARTTDAKYAAHIEAQQGTNYSAILVEL